ncbi:MAG: diguanylate cyclase [Candidatus Sumerlaeota bacterium]|nr:diguanylate cyclase [Candidatus Sumerlaeota bacterium]
MRRNELEIIVEMCLAFDEQAVEIYSNIAARTKDEKLKGFWLQMTSEEKDHVLFWERMLQLVRDGAVPQIFQEPAKVIQELRDQQSKVESLIGQSVSKLALSSQFILAFRLEFYLLHPALARLWHFYSIIRDEPTPETEYNKHITSFINAMREYGASTPELELLGETVYHMWLQIKEASKEADFDSLANILNRRGVFNAMKSLAYFANRKGLTSGLLFIDIDNFKRINDAYGHQTGDDVLRLVAQKIRRMLRKSDVMGRYGGEEFIAFLPQVKSRYLARVAEKIQKAICAAPLADVPVTVSIGAVSKAIGKAVNQDIEAMIKKADECLYEAKNAGRNRVVEIHIPA